MSHIMIQNPNELPLWGLRLLGLSTKTADQIGQFGTGLKESIALLARMELSPVIYSGTCRMDFAVRESDGGHSEIHFKLSEPKGDFEAEKWYGLGIHPNFGHKDWGDPWMIFREIFCNALDEGGVEMLHHDVTTEEPNGKAGSTRFYLPVNKDMMAAYVEVESRLLMLSNREALYESGVHGRIFDKEKNKKGVQIFHKNVWVQEHEAFSLFDYELPNIQLTESRNCDWYQVTMECAYLLREAPASIIRKLLVHCIEDEKNCYESVAIFSRLRGVMSVDSGKEWYKAFRELFGENAVICRNDKHAHDRVEQRGKKPIVVQDIDLYNLLQNAGIPDSSKTLSTEEQMFESFSDPQPECVGVFDEVWGLFEEHGLSGGKCKPAVRQFVQKAGGGTVMYGYYMDNVCYINSEFAGTPRERAACIEEIAHYISEFRDETRAFQTFLVECINRITMPRGVEK